MPLRVRIPFEVHLPDRTSQSRISVHPTSPAPQEGFTTCCALLFVTRVFLRYPLSQYGTVSVFLHGPVTERGYCGETFPSEAWACNNKSLPNRNTPAPAGHLLVIGSGSHLVRENPMRFCDMKNRLSPVAKKYIKAAMPKAKKKTKSAIVQFPSDRLPTLEAVMKWVRRNKSKLKGHPIGMTSLQWKTYEYALSGKTALYAGGIPVVVNEDHEEKV